ncbi:MAG: Peptidase [Parcubacteria group bacterium]|nr:Peptidase [Parcubacteria group bacterium]
MSKEHGLPWQAALLLPFAAGFIGASVSIALSSGAKAIESSGGSGGTTATSTVVSAAAIVPSRPAAPATDQPTRLIIPAIGVNAAVQSVGLSKTGNGAIGIPSNFTDVAWYNRGPAPGEPGIAIIDGHLDGRTVPEAVFYHLGDLAKGDSIYVRDRLGVEQRFVVTSRQQLAYDADPSMLFAQSATSQIALITCAGDWNADKHEYTDRIVVFATLAN